jgi:hypothetical protein
LRGGIRNEISLWPPCPPFGTFGRHSHTIKFLLGVGCSTRRGFPVLFSIVKEQLFASSDVPKQLDPYSPLQIVVSVGKIAIVALEEVTVVSRSISAVVNVAKQVPPFRIFSVDI